ncbi:PREDICTED: uncharacterized protein LOC104707520 isoform X2 [Camelina sativa]|uniref:Uncharacterized protein LOC104707520 isoform X1 n=1 Tax=Camelina sativa TaxID=90675 RepID=A0ABM0T7V3_CAMSA|nr:PREDICTED: uncharacterized protein LOC104707520 isoform X1 [Camelina sativa]XP_010422196.1 PREDICTED: uncharacterized protein LOC104707520 isoform X2 [Camelina sativa]
MFPSFVQRVRSPKTQITTLNSIKGFGFSSLINLKPQIRTGVFWDLDNKPPASFPPYDAAVKLRTAASSFGFVKLMVAYANRHAFSYVPLVVREERRDRKLLNELENTGKVKPPEPYFCGVCDRRFYTNANLINHFKQIHETEHQKRMRQIESSKGHQRVRLLAKYSMKIEKYKRAARKVLTPKEGYGLADELKRAGFWVKMVSDKPEAADVALKEHMVDVMDKREVECVVLVSDDSGYAGVLREAKERCLRTVVIGDLNEGALKRVADVSYSWKEVVMGKAKKEVEKVVGKWKDRDVLKKLEWSYDPALEKERGGSCGVWDYEFDWDDDEIENVTEVEIGDGGDWWKIDNEDGVASSRPCGSHHTIVGIDCAEAANNNLGS